METDGVDLGDTLPDPPEMAETLPEIEPVEVVDAGEQMGEIDAVEQVADSPAAPQWTPHGYDFRGVPGLGGDGNTAVDDPGSASTTGGPLEVPETLRNEEGQPIDLPGVNQAGEILLAPETVGEGVQNPEPPEGWTPGMRA